jgi:mono/diheme cytochrome c family protein
MDPTRLWPCLLLAVALLVQPGSASVAAETTLTIVDAKGEAHDFPIDTLLAHPNADTIMVTGDPAYDADSPRYRVIPISRLLSGIPVEGADILMATALDGFVAQLPAARVLSSDPSGAIAYLAIEDPAKPWPNLKGKDVSAGPYYVVWINPKLSGIGPEAWPFQTIRLELKESVAKRYPAILVADTLPADAPARRGLALFIDNCFVCHRMNGGGEATIGPDLNLPMNPTEYFQPAVLPRFLRDPSSVRHWADQKMPGFAADVLSDRDLQDIVSYLAHMAGRR